MKNNLSKCLLVALLVVSPLIGSSASFANEKTDNVPATSGQEPNTQNTPTNETSASPTIAPVVIGYEDYTDVKVKKNTFVLKVTGEALSKEYEYTLPTELTVKNITGEIEYNKDKNSLIFPKESQFISDIELVSSIVDKKQTYEFDFGFNDEVSTVVTKVTVNTNETSTSDSEEKTTDSDKKQTKEASSDNVSLYVADDPMYLGPLSGAAGSINQDDMGDFPSKFNFTPKIYPGVTLVGYNTTNATTTIAEKQLTKDEMIAIQNYGGYFIYYKRAGIYKGRYVDIQWQFFPSPNLNQNIPLKFHSTLSGYPDNKIMSITNMFYNSRLNTSMYFYDSATAKTVDISGYLSFGNVDNTEYYAFDIDKVKNYVYSFSQNNLKYILATPDGAGVTTNFGVQGQDAGMTTVTPANSFTVMFEDQASFPVTYGYISSGVGAAQWLGNIDLDLLRLGYNAPVLYGDETGTNITDNTLEYRAIQMNPSRGGGQTQIVLPDKYTINMQIEHYNLLNPITASDISVKRLDTNTTITNQFDISVDDNGKIVLDLKNIKNPLIQMDNFPSTMEIKFKTTAKSDVRLMEAYQNIDGQGYYVFPINGNLTYRQPAVENDIVIEANEAQAKIQTDDVPMPEPEKRYTNVTKADGLSREQNELFIGDILQYEIKLNNYSTALENVTLTDQLPDATLFRNVGEYELVVDGNKIEIPDDFYDKELNQLKILIDAIPADAEVSLKYKLQVTGAAQGTELINDAIFSLADGTEMGTSVTTEKVSKIPVLNPEAMTETLSPNTGTVGEQLGNLNLVYVPSFDFGEQMITNKDNQYNANLLKSSDGKEHPNFVQLHDTSQDQSGWKLSMSLGEFYDSQKENVLSNVELVLKNAQVNTFEGLNQSFEGNLSQEVTVSAGGDSNLFAQSTSKEDNQNMTIAFGNTSEKTAESSVVLKVPGSTKKAKDKYTANLDWQLQNVPE